MAKLKLALRKPTFALDRYKLVYFRRLNEIHIGSQVTCAALAKHGRSIATAPAKLADGRRFHHFEVPSGTKPTARIKRERRDIEALVSRAVEQGEYQKSLVLAVSITEDYLVNILKLILRAHPDRLGRGLKRGDSKPTISLEDFVGRGRDEVLEELIRNRIGGALYAKPADYLSYLSSVLEIVIPDDAVEAFIEAKATRDIIVHSNGRANERYVEKAGDRARAALGKPLVVDVIYFDGTIAVMKGLIQQIHDRVCVKYAEDEEVRKRVASFLA